MPPTKAPSTIAEEVTVGVPAVPGVPMVDGGAQHTETLRANPKQEYVSGGQAMWPAAYLRSLPRYIDDISLAFGDDIYERMLLDPIVSANVKTVKFSVLSNGVNLMPAVSKGEEGYDKAVEIRDFCKRSLDSMKTPLLSVLLDMLDALAMGNRVAEMVYHVPAKGPLAGTLTLEKVKVKPRRAVAFVVDSFINVVGLLGLIPGQGGLMMTENLISGEPGPNLLPRRKFAVLSYHPKDGDPRGQSILRPAYAPWWNKMQTIGSYLAAIAKWSDPSLVGTTAEGAQPQPQWDATGNPVVGTDGNQIVLYPEQALMQCLLAFKNGSVVVVPFGAEVDTLQVQGDGGWFTAALNVWDGQITSSILLQKLATMEGEHQARAAAVTHQDVMGLVIHDAKTAVEGMLKGDILSPLVEYNFGEEFLSLVPMVTLSETEQQDFPANANAIANLEKAGYLAPSQYAETDSFLALPQRSAEDIKAAQDAKAAAAMPARDPNADPKNPAAKKKPASDSSKFSGDVQWITVNGKHIPLTTDEEGNASVHPVGEQVPARSAKALLAQSTAKRTGVDIQRYAEEHNEPKFAKDIGGLSLRDNEPVDVLLTKDGKIEHGIELKTMTDNGNGKITMKASALEKKAAWQVANKAAFHTVVFDDTKVFNANGAGKHGDEADRQMYYKRGAGSFRISSMHPVASIADLKKLIEMPTADLPPAARPPATYKEPSGSN